MIHSVTVRRDKKGMGNPGIYRIIKLAAITALKSEKADEPCSISVLLTDDEGIRAINGSMRGIDAATDVLSFPMNEFTVGRYDFNGAERDEVGRVALGDMAISLERARAQGEEFGNGFERETAYLTVHSVLHLLGYDHIREGDDKRRMREREKAIMAELGDI